MTMDKRQGLKHADWCSVQMQNLKAVFLKSQRQDIGANTQKTPQVIFGDLLGWASKLPRKASRNLQEPLLTLGHAHPPGNARKASGGSQMTSLGDPLPPTYKAHGNGSPEPAPGQPRKLPQAAPGTPPPGEPPEPWKNSRKP